MATPANEVLASRNHFAWVVEFGLGDVRKLRMLSKLKEHVAQGLVQWDVLHRADRMEWDEGGAK